MNRLFLVIPFGIFIILAVLFLKALPEDPSAIPSALVGQPFPDFSLQKLKSVDEVLTKKELIGRIHIVNVWATWCGACRFEHPFLMDLANEGVNIVGINYKDEPNKAVAWLAELGDPYVFSIVDLKGELGLNLGVSGAPETFLVGPDGTIHYRHIGIINRIEWNDHFLPLINQLTEAET